MNKEMATLGWREWVTLPDLGVDSIKAKVDTGARTSALHVKKLRYMKDGRNTGLVHFVIHPAQHTEEIEIDAVGKLLERRWIRSSQGHRTLRPVILTTLRIGGREFEIELSLINRDMMGFRMLLGRQALKNLFLIDPSSSFLTGKP